MTSKLTPSQRHYLRILSRWPVDPVRPASVSVQTAIRKHLSPYISTGEPTKSATPQSNAALVTLKAWNEQHEMGQVDVLYSFLENKYQKKYPLPESLRRPASQPTYYDDLLTELDEAPKRNWLARMANSWKGFLRMS